MLTAYLTVFVVGVLLGMAFSPATPQERQWLAERSARLHAARELRVRPRLGISHTLCKCLHAASVAGGGSAPQCNVWGELRLQSPWNPRTQRAVHGNQRLSLFNPA